MKVLFLAGSFHENSYSQALIKTIATMTESLNNLSGTKSQHQALYFAVETLPFYNPDLVSGEALEDKPESVQQLIKIIESCDALVCCTPEYNHSIPAVLKNAIDWASRPAFNSCLKNKPVTIFTQATSDVGGARAQAHLKLVFDSTLSSIYPSHEQMISAIQDKFDRDLKLTDEHTATRIKRHMQAFLAWANNLNSTA